MKELLHLRLPVRKAVFFRNWADKSLQINSGETEEIGIFFHIFFLPKLVYKEKERGAKREKKIPSPKKPQLEANIFQVCVFLKSGSIFKIIRVRIKIKHRCSNLNITK